MAFVREIGRNGVFLLRHMAQDTAYPTQLIQPKIRGISNDHPYKIIVPYEHVTEYSNRIEKYINQPNR